MARKAKKEESTITKYICGTSYLYELKLSNKADGVDMYDSPEALIAKRDCCKQGCGIAKVSIKFVKWHMKHDERKMMSTARKMSKYAAIPIAVSAGRHDQIARDVRGFAARRRRGY